ncbi:potassium channel tetramerisation domain-containing protein [Capsaspora owczarzaki ATCC 30864]|uniref:Potassium channel tetramerization domain-containing protein n=1 Tax=Capsaspora owczarzaki (strain ATCC 30864) TaxID=595528 RepID=A0A0D2WL39_CAPO3|nr:potassium channel tetramerisation domain-containing protein [Capsaspora owczarzaki ATCC 30864]KJE90488.1 potassium channel tetramerization domain-containing protein [Capsaspora owczarzaki ATCC 30864]|eukprot:XP_004364666.1 potassium channel tetramerisation domain-containing protein [Capsaspora owczarzaki ATCC 30864]
MSSKRNSIGESLAAAVAAQTTTSTSPPILYASAASTSSPAASAGGPSGGGHPPSSSSSVTNPLVKGSHPLSIIHTAAGGGVGGLLDHGRGSPVQHHHHLSTSPPQQSSMVNGSVVAVAAAAAAAGGGGSVSGSAPMGYYPELTGSPPYSTSPPPQTSSAGGPGSGMGANAGGQHHLHHHHHHNHHSMVVVQTSTGAAVSTSGTAAASSALARRAIAPPSDAPRYVHLNVGGTFYMTSVDTLFKRGENMLSAMFSGRIAAEPDPDGWYVIDRDGRHFHYILNFLRDGRVNLPESKRERADIAAEASFYLIEDLVRYIQLQEEAKYYPKCSVPLLTSAQEFKLILATTRTPLVVLNYNRGNNKYSYTPNSDENFLKNAELFDKLAFKFNGRVLFVKDIKCPNDILSWVFYGGGIKVAEISCVSLSYPTEKKHTKVEFPEAKIYEETLNVLLFENGAVPSHPPTHHQSPFLGIDDRP